MVISYTGKNQKKAVDDEFKKIDKMVGKEVSPIKKMKKKKFKLFERRK